MHEPRENSKLPYEKYLRSIKRNPGITRKSRRQRKSDIQHKFWEKWSRWTPCSVSCGVGKRYRWRYCSRGCPPGQKEVQIKHCKHHPCMD